MLLFKLLVSLCEETKICPVRLTHARTCIVMFNFHYASNHKCWNQVLCSSCSSRSLMGLSHEVRPLSSSDNSKKVKYFKKEQDNKKRGVQPSCFITEPSISIHISLFSRPCVCVFLFWGFVLPACILYSCLLIYWQFPALPCCHSITVIIQTSLKSFILSCPSSSKRPCRSTDLKSACSG